MEETINRQEAIVAVCKSECGIGFCEISCPEVDALKALPSAQPERKRGQWIPNMVWDAVNGYRCSQCGAYHVARYKFCHNCGADMREESE